MTYNHICIYACFISEVLQKYASSFGHSAVHAASWKVLGPMFTGSPHCRACVFAFAHAIDGTVPVWEELRSCTSYAHHHIEQEAFHLLTTKAYATNSSSLGSTHVYAESRISLQVQYLLHFPRTPRLDWLVPASIYHILIFLHIHADRSRQKGSRAKLSRSGRNSPWKSHGLMRPRGSCLLRLRGCTVTASCELPQPLPNQKQVRLAP